MKNVKTLLYHAYRHPVWTVKKDVFITKKGKVCCGCGKPCVTLYRKERIEKMVEKNEYTTVEEIIHDPKMFSSTNTLIVCIDCLDAARKVVFDAFLEDDEDAFVTDEKDEF